MKRIVGWLALAALIAVSSGCNEDKMEKAIGSSVAKSIEATYRVNSDPVLNAWINNVGHTVVAMSTRQHIPYHFKILETDMVNAFAAPWGYVYFTRGILDFAEDEDEIWFVMGHEVGHVVHRDAIKAAKRSILWSIGLSILSRRSRTTANVLGIGLGLLSLHYSREDERDADDMGVLLAYRAGHDPRAGLKFFERLMAEKEKKRPSKLEALLSTHPLTSARIARQRAKPYVKQEDPAILTHLGRSFVRRGRVLQGLQLLTRAVKGAPQSADAHLALAEAAYERGYLDLARREAERAAELMGYVPAFRRRAALIAMAQPSDWPEPSADQRIRLAQALGQAASSTGHIEATAAAAAASAARLSKQVRPLTARSNELQSLLSQLAARSEKITSRMQDALVSTNAAIASAVECTYRLEAVADNLEETANLADKFVPSTLRPAMRRAQAADSWPRGVDGWISRALAEVRASQDDAREATSLAAAATGPAMQAVESARDAAVTVARLLQIGDNDLLYAGLRTATARMKSQAEAASAALEKSRKVAARGRARLLVAAINLAAVGATPEELRSMQRLVAYFAGVPAEKVGELVKRGLGLGEAAACIIAAPGLNMSPDDLAEAALARGSAVDAIASRGRDLWPTAALLKFIAEAMGAEVPTGSHEAPRLTS